MSWDTFQYLLQCLFDTFWIKRCCQLYFLHLNYGIMNPREKERRQTGGRKKWRETTTELTCLPARARRVNTLFMGGACGIVGWQQQNMLRRSHIITSTIWYSWNRRNSHLKAKVEGLAKQHVSQTLVYWFLCRLYWKRMLQNSRIS